MSKTRSVVHCGNGPELHSNWQEKTLASISPYPYPVVDMITGSPILAGSRQVSCFSLFKPKKARSGYEQIKTDGELESANSKHKNCQIL
jgi:hypothetical protein